ncbi:thiosulfate sulfurtransferase GlpE [Psychrobium sp. 1_MG-2023]|uniref:thiosulfate sulfurtransferase GlpE n=1 Tax=Psychrobium sp. 1_MG-2023 TaxID=3062624 RepID=UPI000C33B450|nr:thiosulfate sulfurtransferase GlpE [Psychrobium sp. 1_MG-2023]MDP2561716.1 thiosulfate sulfurtransferase GlpE [Psychrobium sp. 1_MG-2023]PKF57116.1 thiosulfate sulfurtransferase GlpE [Alteromonadales bacterium alter-6D02]
MQFKHLTVPQLHQLVSEQTINIVDTRDPQSFALSHIDGAFNLNQGNLEQYLADCDMDQPLVVCCYHGISSQGVAQFLVERGFDEVYSLDGGFEAYQQQTS